MICVCVSCAFELAYVLGFLPPQYKKGTVKVEDVIHAMAHVSHIQYAIMHEYVEEGEGLGYKVKKGLFFYRVIVTSSSSGLYGNFGQINYSAG